MLGFARLTSLLFLLALTTANVAAQAFSVDANSGPDAVVVFDGNKGVLHTGGVEIEVTRTNDGDDIVFSAFGVSVRLKGANLDRNDEGDAAGEEGNFGTWQRVEP